MKKCQNCGQPILDSEFLHSLGYVNEAKLCENCRRKIHFYRDHTKVERSLLAEWRRIRVKRSPLEFEKWAKDPEVAIFRFGGRFFGCSSWAGASYDQKTLFFVNSRCLEKGDEKEFKPEILVDIRRMVKIRYNEDNTTTKNEYFVISRSEETEETEAQGTLDFLRSYYKTTLSGGGRDRNYRESVENAEYETLVTTSNSARSGRFGCNIELIVVTGEYDITGNGIA